MSLGWLLSLIVGVVAGLLAARWWGQRKGSTVPTTFPSDAAHVVELLRRANRAAATCLVSADAELPLLSVAEPRPASSSIDRLTATARLALSDGREHVVHESGGIVAVGDGSLGAGVLVGTDDLRPAQIASAVSDLRRLLAELRLSLDRERTGPPPLRSGDGPESVEAVAFSLSERAHRESSRPIAVVIRDPTTRRASVVAVSDGLPRRLIGLNVPTESAVGRACISNVPVVAGTREELLGGDSRDRRRAEEQGSAYPLHDGRQGVGALVVFGPPNAMNSETRERLLTLTVDAAPRLSTALALRAAESRALTDELTGLPNRRGLERAVTNARGEAAALLMADIDHFKKLNDGFGHAAGDAALRHLAQIFRATLREGDVASRIGGEEFALWLPTASLTVAAEIAERIRRATADAALSWAGADIRMTCSIGVAAYPESVGHPDNLYAAADAALYRAK